MKKPAFLLILFLGLLQTLSAQDWLSGYSYRKKIVIDKSKVVALNVNAGTTVIKQDLPNFPVLIELQHKDLVYIPGSCSNKIRNPEGRDIAFTLGSNSQVPLNFQLEHYDPVKGILICWVRIGLLSANGTASAASSLYFYYGSNLLHAPLGPESIITWSGDFNRIWHLKKSADAIASADAQSGLSTLAATGGPGSSQANFKDAKIGSGIELNGTSQWFRSAADTSTAITLSAWINLSKLGLEQVILANDSSQSEFRNGYVLKITAQGKPAIDVYRSKTSYAITGSQVLEAGKWYHLIATIADNQAFIILNGTRVGSQSAVRLGSGGQVRIGSSKQNTAFLGGKIDEIRLMKITKSQEFLKTEYVNQDNPGQFYTVFDEEYNPDEFFRYTGPSNGLWTSPANWSKSSIPGPGSSVVIPSGKSVRINGTAPVSIGRLILKTGTLLSVEKSAEVSCLLQIDVNSDVKLYNTVKLKLGGDLLNNGRISLNQSSGTLLFAGPNPVQLFSGAGSALVYGMENEQSQPGNTLFLEASLQVSGYVYAKRGILKVNENLTLLASDTSHAASLLPVPAEQATIIGRVQVQHYLDGPYAPPSTARSWRLLSSPVYHHKTPERYTISAFKNNMFITGPGGTNNGFDPSPLNGGTIYTHDQSLPGTLSQKYLPINNAGTDLPLGRGIYVFSRGSRYAPNAYAEQIRQTPFSNPSGFYLTHTGELYLGDLELALENKNSGSAGDGFHLLGNPYASAITWGLLSKLNLSPFIWLYDPINKDYWVTDDPLTTIPSGAGFFARVKAGFVIGSIKFTESSKNIDTLGSKKSAVNKIQAISPGKVLTNTVSSLESGSPSSQKLEIVLSRGSFSQRYRSTFELEGNDQIDNNDALKIGEGFVNLAGVAEKTNLSIEQRGPIKERTQIQLYIAGWENGTYKLDIRQTEALKKSTEIKIIDHHLQHESKLKSLHEDYLFDIDLSVPGSQGINRFSVELTPIARSIPEAGKENEILVYPNPISDRLFLKSSISSGDLVVKFTNIQGYQTKYIKAKEGAGGPYFDCSNLQTGFYLLTVYNRQNMSVVKTFKVFRK